MSTAAFSLDQLGWRPCFSQQLTLEDLEAAYLARVVTVHRDRLRVMSEHGEGDVTLAGRLAHDGEASMTVGDWVLVELAAARVLRAIERHSLISRITVGLAQRLQPIAANVDTLFIVSSCNEDFNPSRLERYLAVALQARVDPVIVLTKADLCASNVDYVSKTQRVAPRASVVAVNALAADSVAALTPWLGRGQTVAFVGSSGVGKSTLINRLIDRDAQAIGGIRTHDGKGRHTTTARQMIAMPGGAWLIDTPGMRELKIGAVEAGVSAVFADVEEIASQCRFRDCGHQGDAGCALEDARQRGQLDARRLKSYLKLQREAANAKRTLRERRERDRRFGRECKTTLRERRREKGIE
jgi:ribosome biogenesis GTPase